MNRVNRAALTATATATAGLLIAAGPAASAAAAAKAHRVASCTADGDYAICDAAGNATAPHDIYVHVTSSPDQSALVTWDVVCSKGDGAGSASGQFTAPTPVRRVIRHPYARPDSCTVAAGAQLNRGGHLKVWISYRR
jgi:hypothetical protein